MKICISSEGNNLDSNVDARFGRCKFFIFADTDNMKIDAVENPNTEAMGGVGIKSAQLAVDVGAKAIVTGNVGPNAFEVLSKAGVKVFTNAQGKTVKEAIGDYKNSKLTEKTQ
ncbi:MAG TPA: NifB/NifX family molybdenum-iron cluster-binding protein [Elusimicrobiales bacterium]|nr:NifB/NifX family molybdenum-iron cluster-binding protein [Elusimicrobiales bacterium]